LALKNIKKTPKILLADHRNFFFIHNCSCVLGESTAPHPSFSSQPLFVCKFRCKGAQKLFKTLAPSLQYWVSLTFVDAYSRTLRPKDLYNVRPVPREEWFLGGQWNAPTMLKNCPNAKAYFLEPVFRIRIRFMLIWTRIQPKNQMRIRILVPDPDPDPCLDKIE
jgi:hypothetical protein